MNKVIKKLDLGMIDVSDNDSLSLVSYDVKNVYLENVELFQIEGKNPRFFRSPFLFLSIINDMTYSWVLGIIVERDNLLPCLVHFEAIDQCRKGQNEDDLLKDWVHSSVVKFFNKIKLKIRKSSWPLDNSTSNG